MVFRRAQSEYLMTELVLRGLDAKANYEVILRKLTGPRVRPYNLVCISDFRRLAQPSNKEIA